MSLFGRFAASAKNVLCNFTRLNPVLASSSQGTAGLLSVLSRFESTVTYDVLEAVHLKGPVIKKR